MTPTETPDSARPSGVWDVPPGRPSLADDLARTAEFAAVQRPPAASATWRHSVLVATIAWVVLGAVFTLFRANTLLAQGTPSAWLEAASSTLVYVGTWVLLLPLLMRAVVTWPLESPWRRWVLARRGLLLAGTAVLIAAAQVIAYVWIMAQWTGVTSIVNLEPAALELAGRFEENLAIAAVMVAVWAAWRQRQLVNWRALQSAYLAAELSASRLQSLGMELRPHFLFNTLNAITGMVWADQAVAEQMILQLSELLRRTLEAGQSPTCTMAEEREVLELYLAIQRIRFGSRLSVRVDLAPDVLAGEVPRFLLQPLVENAFQHGLSKKPGPVSLEIVAVRVHDRLRIQVMDDGAGLPPDGSLQESTGVGNSRRRLATLYGPSASLEILPRAGGGAESRVELPWRALPTVPSSSSLS